MKTLIALCLLSVGFGLSEIGSKNIVDDLILGLLENLRTNLTNVTIPNINATVNTSGILVDLLTDNVLAQYLETFEVAEIHTTIIPLRLDNLTLVWDNVLLEGWYDLAGSVDLEILQDVVELTGDGLASIDLGQLSVTIGFTLTATGGHFQIKDIQNLIVTLGTSTIQLENIMGGGDIEILVNTFLSFFVPEFVHDQGPAIIEVIKPYLKDFLNSILAGNSTMEYDYY